MAISELEPAFLLHARPYRNTSILANFLTLNHGRIDAVARGVRGQKSKVKGYLQPFVPININWYGHGELVTLKTVEPNGFIKKLSSQALLYGIYCNELLIRVFRGQQAHPEIFYAYHELLTNLTEQGAEEAQLRLFEMILLEGLGYAIQLNRDCETNNIVEPELWYHYVADKGVMLVNDLTLEKQKAFLGEHLLAIANKDFSSAEVLKTAKRLMRQALRPLLGDKPLNSRELFIN